LSEIALDNLISFKRDTAFRKQFFVPDSFAHPAKMDAQLLIWIVERYTKVGDVILDPMAGSGTTMLACQMGRHVILTELEEKFCKMMAANWEVVKLHPQLGYEMGECQIVQGDARNLEGVLTDTIISSPPYGNRLSDAAVNDGDKQRMSYRQSLADCVVTSPPYAEAQEGGGIAKRGYHGSKAIDHEIGNRSYMPEQAGQSNGQISNLPYGNIDAVVTSPPYEEAMGKKHHSPVADKIFKEKGLGVYVNRVDAVVTSPPYENQVHGTREKRATWNNPLDRDKDFIASLPVGYSEGDNIGNLKGESYLQAMLQVYQQCHKVLKPQGLMILVTKNFIRDRTIIRLDLDTIRLCEQAGFKLLEHHYRKLPSQSFWRILYWNKYHIKIDFEDVLAFRSVE